MEARDTSVFTEQKDYTLSNLWMSCNAGDIITNPDDQRDYVYTTKQASKLIESILMGIPIPTVYLCQEDDETYTVIDGQQRITSFVKYFSNEYPLTGLTEMPELNGKRYRDLEKPVQRKLNNSSLRSICILKESQELKYEIFARLNQGSVSLKPQELRNCIYRGSFNSLLEELSRNKHLPVLFHDENRRKSYQDRILRFYALRQFTEYKSSILKTQNSFMAAHQSDSPDEIGKLKSLFTETIDIIRQVLGESAFMAVDRESSNAKEKFSGSVYDSIMVPFSFFSSHDIMAHSDEIRAAIDDLKRNNTKYLEDTYAATGSRKRVMGRIMAVYDLLSHITGTHGKGDEERAFSDEVKKQLWHPGYICSYCHNEILSIDDCEVDHIIPFSKGGKTEISNAQLLHRHCNREKSDSYGDWNDDEDSSE